MSRVCRFLNLTARDCRRLDRVMLVAAGSAIESLARRAAELFGVTLLVLHVVENTDQDTESNQVHLTDDTRWVGHVVWAGDSGSLPQRDHAVIEIADRVDALMVRRGGRIHAALQQRLESRKDASVRIAIFDSGNSRKLDSTARQLMQMGAVGWYLPRIDPPLDSADKDESRKDEPKGPFTLAEDVEQPSWMLAEGEWLIHCTRVPQGPLPGQTLNQYQDELLLPSDESDSDLEASPLDALRRIVRSGRLVASAVASAKRWPVVCFSERALIDLLRNRRYRPHLKRWDYEPFGVAIRKTAATAHGIEPVIYGEPSGRKKLTADQQYRFQASGETYDWTMEREWRSRGDVDLNRWDPEDVRVFVPHVDFAQRLHATCPWRIDLIACEPKSAASC